MIRSTSRRKDNQQRDEERTGRGGAHQQPGGDHDNKKRIKRTLQRGGKGKRAG